MESETPTATDAEPSRARFVASQALVCWGAAVLLGAAAARAAVWTERVSAPALIFPLLVGFCLGLMLAGLMRLLQFNHRPTLLIGALLAGLTAATGQHYFFYRDHLAEFNSYVAQHPEAAPVSDAAPGFGAFMQGQADRVGRPITANYTLRGAAAWASWVLDGFLLLTGVVVVVFLLNRANSGIA